jgi:hypothetical protein
MDVSAEILRNHLIYGSSDNTNPAGLSSNRSLNYASGASIQRPDTIGVRLIPYTLRYQDSVGLFGAENHFVRVNVKLDGTYTGRCFEERDWECAMITREEDLDPIYGLANQAVIDLNADPETINTYEPASLDDTLSPKTRAYLSVDLNNLKTGNIYIDSWLDARLYTSEREEHPYDRMYIPENSFFYIGFHARNTRRLPYNVECLIGDNYVSELTMTAEERRYIARNALR